MAIETSCDDTCVAILEKSNTGAARLYFNEKITSNNREFGGVHPAVAVLSHTTNLAPLLEKALRALPRKSDDNAATISVDGVLRSKPDFVSVTRGPGMVSNLATGLNVAKGLSVAWGVPLLAVNHMQAHAITPHLIAALQKGEQDGAWDTVETEAEVDPGQRRRHDPQFPFLSVLVSGGHTLLLRSESLNDHTILAEPMNIAVGDMLDKCARMIVPPEILDEEGGTSGMYGPVFEEFTFPGSTSSEEDYDYRYTPPTRRAEESEMFEAGYDWSLTPPLARSGERESVMDLFDFAGLNGTVLKIMLKNKDMDITERRTLARAAMTLAFQHITSRLVYAIHGRLDKHPSPNPAPPRPEPKEGEEPPIKTVVLSGGVASNKFFRHVVRKSLDVLGYSDIAIVAPPVPFCVDNAAMIAWTGMEMYEAGWRTDLGVVALRKWSLDNNEEGQGILGAGYWYQASVDTK